jgi:hypothetical protein
VVNRSKAVEPCRDVLLDAMVPPDFGQQLVNEPRDLADVLNRALLAQTH